MSDIPQDVPNTKIVNKIFDMKRIALIALSMLILASCSVTRQRQTFVSFLDYRPYTSADFFLSPDPCVKDFDSIGQLYIDIVPGTATPTSNTKKDFSDNIYNNGGLTAPTYEVISSEELLETAVSKALEMGANGIANLKITATRNELGQATRYEISGLCIRIK